MYNIGDMVRIKERDQIKHLDWLGYDNRMDKYCGNVYAVKRIDNQFREYPAYKLTGVYEEGSTINSDGYWMWDETWLEPYKEFNIDLSEEDLLKMF